MTEENVPLEMHRNRLVNGQASPGNPPACLATTNSLGTSASHCASTLWAPLF